MTRMTHSAYTPLVGESAPMRRLRELISIVAPTPIPVLIHGETGSGKELVAASLHEHSRRDGAFVAFNICALGESMFEDALFGHVRGAYTGALNESLGFLREANGGTVFLDEISGLPLNLQAKLLRAIETGVFRPIGSQRDARSDFRTISATNESLEDLVAGARFRSDLAHRLSGIVIAVPSLAERLDDIPLLVEHFVHGKPVTPRALLALQDRPWPGNVRELKQVVEAAAVFARDQLDVDAIEIATRHRVAPALIKSRDPHADDRERLSELLASANWDVDRAAAAAGVHRTTMYRRVKRLGIRLAKLG